MSMNPEWKRKWVEALRSGDYEQTTQHLQDMDGFCCLGVLCDIVKDEVGLKWQERDDGIKFIGGVDDLPPIEVQRFVGVREWPAIEIDCYDDGEPRRKYLTELNDDMNWTFIEIADAIEGSDL